MGATTIRWSTRAGAIAIIALLVAACGGGAASPTPEEATPSPSLAETPVVTPDATPALTPEETPVAGGDQTDGGIPGDAGDGLADAREVEFGTIEGALVRDDDDRDDYFVVELPLDAVITLSATMPLDLEGRTRVALFFNGAEQFANVLGPGASETWRWALINAEGAQLFVHVRDGMGGYTLELAAESQTDGGKAGDAPGEPGLALEVVPTGSFDGVVNGQRSTDPHDWYRLTSPAAGSFSMEVALGADSGADARVVVHQDGRQVESVPVRRGTPTTVSFDVNADSTYEFRLESVGLALYTVTFP